MVKEVGQVKQQVLDKIIQRIVAVAQPEKIILDVETILSQEWCEQEVGVSDADSSRIDP